MKVKVLVIQCVQLFATPLTVAHRAPSPWNSPGKNTRVGCHSLLQGIFLTQRLNPGFLHCRQILYHLSRQGSLPTVVIILQYMQIKPLSIIP